LLPNRMPNFIKLAPIRMSDIKISAEVDSPAKSLASPVPTPIPATPMYSSRYAPPNKRAPSSTPVVTTLDFNSAAFPSLNSESPLASQKPTGVGGFKQKILDLIAKEALDEAERNRVIEEDPKKMTKEELLNAGWAILPLGNIKESGLRFNQRMCELRLGQSDEIRVSPYGELV